MDSVETSFEGHTWHPDPSSLSVAWPPWDEEPYLLYASATTIFTQATKTGYNKTGSKTNPSISWFWWVTVVAKPSHETDTSEPLRQRRSSVRRFCSLNMLFKLLKPVSSSIRTMLSPSLDCAVWGIRRDNTGIVNSHTFEHSFATFMTFLPLCKSCKLT